MSTPQLKSLKVTRVTVDQEAFTIRPSNTTATINRRGMRAIPRSNKGLNLQSLIPHICAESEDKLRDAKLEWNIIAFYATLLKGRQKKKRTLQG
jgi:hypothetical protein